MDPHELRTFLALRLRIQRYFLSDQWALSTVPTRAIAIALSVASSRLAPVVELGVYLYPDRLVNFLEQVIQVKEALTPSSPSAIMPRARGPKTILPHLRSVINRRRVKKQILIS